MAVDGKVIERGLKDDTHCGNRCRDTNDPDHSYQDRDPDTSPTRSNPENCDQQRVPCPWCRA